MIRSFDALVMLDRHEIQNSSISHLIEPTAIINREESGVFAKNQKLEAKRSTLSVKVYVLNHFVPLDT